MSTAMYPLGMKSWNNSLPQGGYKTWKGAGVFQNPVGTAPTNVRPLSNLDPGNVFPSKFGLPRPMKHYRKGRTAAARATNPEFSQVETDLVDFNLNRAVRSSQGGARVLLSAMEIPNGVAFSQRSAGDNVGGPCVDCHGATVVSSWAPIADLTDKPEPVTTNHVFCCNQERKARRRVLPASTLLPKTYFQTTKAMLQNRCQTFNQRSFNFLRGRELEDDEDELFYPPAPAAPRDADNGGEAGDGDGDGDVAPGCPLGSSSNSKQRRGQAQDPDHAPLSSSAALRRREAVGAAAKPGSPGAMGNLYVAQCFPNFTIRASAELAVMGVILRLLRSKKLLTDAQFLELQAGATGLPSLLAALDGILAPSEHAELTAFLHASRLMTFANAAQARGCARVYYKPNNPQFAQQGAVSSATRTLKLNVDTISTAAAHMNRLNERLSMRGSEPATPFIYKDKVPRCNPATYSGNPFFFQGQHQNHTACPTSRARPEQ